jgi:hypothetical protein
MGLVCAKVDDDDDDDEDNENMPATMTAVAIMMRRMMLPVLLLLGAAIAGRAGIQKPANRAAAPIRSAASLATETITSPPRTME